MRVLEFITPSTVGGAEICVLDSCRALISLGVEVDVVCPEGRPFIKYAAKRGIECISWKTHGKIDPTTVVKLKNLIRQRRIDLVHTHLSTASLLGAWAARLAGIPSVAHVHGLNNAFCFKSSGRIVAVSEVVKQYLVAQGLKAEKISVVHNGVDLNRFKPESIESARRTLGYDLDIPILGVFGRLSIEKGQIIAIKAMPEILSRHPKTRLLIVGRGHEDNTLKSAAAGLGVEKNVDFLGFSPDVRPLMSTCDVILIPSFKEGFGMSAVEAMALGRPVVASKVGGLTEIVIEGETGFTIPSGDSNALSKSAQILIEDRLTAECIGKQARLRAEECFDLNKQTERFLTVVKEMTQNS